MSSGTRNSEGRTGEEGQSEEGPRQESLTPIFDSLWRELQMADQDLPLDRCQICKIPRRDHQGRVHAFAPQGAPVDVSQFARKRPGALSRDDDATPTEQIPTDDLSVSPQPFDPVLRMALIDKGIITPDDLVQAQRKIAVFTRTVTGGMANAGTGEGAIRPNAPGP